MDSVHWALLAISWLKNRNQRKNRIFGAAKVHYKSRTQSPSLLAMNSSTACALYNERTRTETNLKMHLEFEHKLQLTWILTFVCLHFDRVTVFVTLLLFLMRESPTDFSLFSNFFLRSFFLFFFFVFTTPIVSFSLFVLLAFLLLSANAPFFLMGLLFFVFFASLWVFLPMLNFCTSMKKKIFQVKDTHGFGHKRKKTMDAVKNTLHVSPRHDKKYNCSEYTWFGRIKTLQYTHAHLHMHGNKIRSRNFDHWSCSTYHYSRKYAAINIWTWRTYVQV